MNIIIVGIGKVGIALTSQLSKDNNVTVIDVHPDIIDNIINVYDVMGICGNGANYQIQKDAGCEKADLLIASTSSDEVNILACLVAKKLGARHTIARIRNPEYEEQLRFMREDLGLSMYVNPEKAAAREISRVLRFPAAMKVETFSKGRLELIEYRIPENSKLIGKTLSEIYKELRIRVLVCAVSRKEETYIPGGDFKLESGDKIYLTSSPENIAAFFRKLGVFRDRVSSVIIVGASRLCYYLAKELFKTGMSVKIIDNDESKCIKISEMLPKALVIVGDGTDSDLLLEEGLQDTDAFISITGLDEANILMSLCVARETKGKCKIITKINRKTLKDLVSSDTMIDTVFSPSSVTTELIVQYIRSMNSTKASKIKTFHRLVDGRVDALEFNVSDESKVVGKPLKELNLKKGVLVAGIVSRSGKMIIPSGNDVIHGGDDVIVVTTNSFLRDINNILE